LPLRNSVLVVVLFGLSKKVAHVVVVVVAIVRVGLTMP